MAPEPALAPETAAAALPNTSKETDNVEELKSDINNLGTATKTSEKGRLENSGDSLKNEGKSNEELNHVAGFKLAVIVTCISLAIFCVALDNTSQCWLQRHVY